MVFICSVQEGEQLLRSALEGFQKQLGENHPQAAGDPLALFDLLGVSNTEDASDRDWLIGLTLPHLRHDVMSISFPSP